MAGWLATGPTGVILTTMNSSFGVAKSVCDDFEKGLINTTNVATKSGIDWKLNNKNVVTWSGWQRIDKAEVEAGRSEKPREKIVDVEKMLNVASG